MRRIKFLPNNALALSRLLPQLAGGLLLSLIVVFLLVGCSDISSSEDKEYYERGGQSTKPDAVSADKRFQIRDDTIQLNNVYKRSPSNPEDETFWLTDTARSNLYTPTDELFLALEQNRFEGRIGSFRKNIPEDRWYPTTTDCSYPAGRLNPIIGDKLRFRMDGAAPYDTVIKFESQSFGLCPELLAACQVLVRLDATVYASGTIPKTYLCRVPYVTSVLKEAYALFKPTWRN